MKINKRIQERQILYYSIYGLFALNIMAYLLLTYIARFCVYYDLFYKKVLVNNSQLFFLPIANIFLVFILVITYYYLDTKGEPLFSIFKTFARADWYSRIATVIITIVLIKNVININNISYLYIIIFISFCWNFYVETKMISAIINAQDEKIQMLKNKNTIKLTDEEVINYEKAYDMGKRAFFIMILTVPFTFVLNNILFFFIYCILYSIIEVFLLKDTYFLIFDKKKAQNKLILNFLILVFGFIIVFLLNHKILECKPYSFTQNEIISFVSFFTIPLYYPVIYVYLILKRRC